MAKAKKKYTMGTIWFLILLIVSVLASVPEIAVNRTMIWLILGICGAIIAISNIQKKEEISFLIGTTALLIIITAFLIIPELSIIADSIIGMFLVNLAVGFGVAGFVVALGLISRLGLEK